MKKITALILLLTVLGSVQAMSPKAEDVVQLVVNYQITEGIKPQERFVFDTLAGVVECSVEEFLGRKDALTWITFCEVLKKKFSKDDNLTNSQRKVLIYLYDCIKTVTIEELKG